MRGLILPVLALLAVIYFAYHTWEGNRGVMAWMRLNSEVGDAEAQLERIEQERRVLEHRVLLLRPDHLDPDMLEERARAMLNMGREGEVLVFENQNSPN